LHEVSSGSLTRCLVVAGRVITGRSGFMTSFREQQVYYARARADRAVKPGL
jgi:hypothetical protein